MTPSSPTSSTTGPERGLQAPFRSNAVWAGLGGLSFVAAMAVAYRPEFDTAGGVVLALLPWLVLAAMAVLVLDRSTPLRLLAVIVAIAGWTILLFDDPRWSVLSFAIYVMCFTADQMRPVPGVALAGLATAAWTWAWTIVDTPSWTVILPGVVFAAGTILSVAMHRTARMADEQAALVQTLQDTRDELAQAERERGVLEERARLAGEIHDTLAQGLTSIVLLARAGRRSSDPNESLSAIESSAEENLEQARRIVSADHLDAFDGTSLSEALKRHVETELPAGLTGEFRVVGTARRLTGDIEVTVLRATQEALRNVIAHADASSVDVTLTYLDEAVALDVRDDGVGFVAGHVADRGTLTGGQGLDTLSRRARALSGELTIESPPDGGSVLSLVLPVGAS